MLPFDHPWRELDYLFRGERLLGDQLAHDDPRKNNGDTMSIP
jgi:hypothetical protein